MAVKIGLKTLARNNPESVYSMVTFSAYSWAENSLLFFLLFDVFIDSEQEANKHIKHKSPQRIC
jgi:hypothetical protein